jgi:predicted Zn-dependent protease
MILGVLAASRSPDAAGAVMMGGTAGSVQGQLNFSRDMEREADRLGFNVHAQAGFDSQGFVGMFQKLQQASRLNDNGNYPYLRSHPLTTERIGDMQGRLGLGKTFAPIETSIEHAMMAARAKALMSPQTDDMQILSDTLEKDFSPQLPVAKQAAMLYAGVMAYTQQRRAAQAREALNSLLQLVHADPAGLHAAQWLAADTERRLNKPVQCLQTLGSKVVDRARVMLQTQCRLEAKQATLATQASDAMQLWLAQYPRDAMAWDLSSQALLQTGDRLRALRADAEFHVVRWDEVGALDRLRAAQDLAKQLAKEGKLDRAGHMEASIIDSRLRSLERMRRELLQPH